jgi:plastocyanin
MRNRHATSPFPGMCQSNATMWRTGASSLMSHLRSARLGRRIFAAHMLAFALLMVGLGVASAAEVKVSIVQPSDTDDWRYDPSSAMVPVGTTVTWVNEGNTPVTVTSADGLFESDTLDPGDSFSVTFDAPGTFRYFCVPYPHMKGKIEVTRSRDAESRPTPGR